MNLRLVKNDVRQMKFRKFINRTDIRVEMADHADDREAMVCCNRVVNYNLGATVTFLVAVQVIVDKRQGMISCGEIYVYA